MPRYGVRIKKEAAIRCVDLQIHIYEGNNND
jgi:hypothetical protein